MSTHQPLAAVLQASRCSLTQAWLGLAARVALVAAVLALVGCASLPGGVQRPVTTALHDDAVATELGRIALASAASAPASAADAERGVLSGFRLLPDGDQALDARIALARRAWKTLDVQYYLIARDTTGLQFLRELRDAAVRGVRVRLLIDDLYASGHDALLAGLAAHPNVAVRMFNPLPVRSGSMVSRVVLSLHEFARINGRMHNKLFVADNAFALTGGRNIADEYFERGGPANFIDMDILSTGPVVRELSAVFDRYWNSEQVYPVQSLVGAGFDAAAARRAFDARLLGVAAAAMTTAAGVDPLGRGSVSSQLAAGFVEQHFAKVKVHADAPNKIADAEVLESGRSVMNNKLDLMRTARAEVLVASPYFIPGERGMAVMRQALANNVRLTVMTNSLATTDEPLVHFGYARYRHAMLKMGVELHELMPGRDRQPGTKGELTGSLGRLHAKLAVVDSRWLFIGSMNMDGRSARWNTEIGLVIDSSELAGEVAGLLRRERLPGSYRLRVAANESQNIEWVAGGSGSGAPVVHGAEPDLDWGRQLRMSVVGAFVGEELL